MTDTSHTFATGPTIREIWVRRSDGGLEYKPWLIFEVIFSNNAQNKIVNFLKFEHERTYRKWLRPPSSFLVKSVAEDYGNLVSPSDLMPPRLLAIEHFRLEGLPTELKDESWCILGDSVGGISPSKPITHNAHLSVESKNESADILVSPGLLCRIPIMYEGALHYVFQLAEKNLREKGQVFYKPIGGHLKHTKKFEAVISKLGLRRKKNKMPQDIDDIAFFSPPDRFNQFREILLEEIISFDSDLLVPLRDILQIELLEELGPQRASDGIPLLSKEEVIINDSEALYR